SDRDSAGYRAAVDEAKQLMKSPWMEGTKLVLDVSPADHERLKSEFDLARVTFVDRETALTVVTLTDSDQQISNLYKRTSSDKSSLLKNSVIILPPGARLPRERHEGVQIVLIDQLLLGPAISVDLGLMLAVLRLIKNQA